MFCAAIGVPGSAALAFADKVSKNPWQAFALALLYEQALGCAGFSQERLAVSGRGLEQGYCYLSDQQRRIQGKEDTCEGIFIVKEREETL